MFEYLMPLLYTRSFRNSLLRTCAAAVRQQIAYGRENQVPWGISESAFSALDSTKLSVPGLRHPHPGAPAADWKKTWWWRRTPPCSPCWWSPRRRSKICAVS